VILATLTGIALQQWAGLHDAGELGFFAGLVVAMFVPAKRGCRIS
jgi:hypothetical protein